MMTTTVDQSKAQAFMGKVVGDFSAALTGAMCVLGDRLDLFKNLDAAGAATSEELAQRTGLNERYLREWLSALFCAGYLSYDPADRRFTLPAEHAQVLAAEGTPLFLGGRSRICRRCSACSMGSRAHRGAGCGAGAPGNL